MNWGKRNTESTGASCGDPAPRPAKGRLGWRLWLALLVLAGAGIWLVVGRSESPTRRAEREVQRILSAVRRQDRTSFSIYSVLEAMQHWPRPFPQLAATALGPEDLTYDAANNLAAFGKLAVPILTNALAGDRSVSVRSTAAEALGEMGDARLLATLHAAFAREKDERVQSSILRAMGGMADEMVEPFLISVLQGTNAPHVRSTAVNALRDPRLPQTVSALTNSLATDTNQIVRQAVVERLAYVVDPAVKPALLQAFASDSDISVCQAAARALRGHPGDDTVSALIAAVEERNKPGSVLAAAVSALRGMTNASVPQFLLATLNHATPEVRSEVAQALEDFPGEKTETALLETLTSDSDADVREAAANVLGELEGASTNRALLPALIQCLQNDPEPEVRAAAASALNRIGGEEVVKALTAALKTERKGEVQVAAIGGIYQRRGSEIASFLLRLVDDANLEPPARAEVVRCLGQTRAPTVTAKLVGLLQADPEEEVRVAAATALGLLDNTNAAAALRHVLVKETPDNALTAPAVTPGPGNFSPTTFNPAAGSRWFSSLRGAAAEALGGMQTARTPETVAVLTALLLKEKDDSIRESTVKALGLLRDTNALPALLTVLQNDSSRETRAEAATALGKLGCAGAIPRLETAFQRDRDRNVRAAAVRSLAVLAGAQRAGFFITIFEADPTIRAELASILGRIGSPEAVAILLESLREDGSVNRAAVAKALGIAGDARAVKPLIEILATDRDVNTRDAIVSALGWLGDPEAVPALEKALQDRSSSVRQNAAWSLGHIGDVRAAAALSQALKDRDASVRFAAAFALAEVGARETVPAITQLLRDTDEQARLAAASALAFLDDIQGLTVLRDKLHSKSTWERFTALISLLRLNTPEARRLLTDSHDSDATLAACIEGGLRLGGAGAATNMLCTAGDSEDMTADYRHFGARALVLFTDPATLPALHANANDPRDDVRAAVRVAIGRIEKKTAAKKLQPDHR